MERKAAALSKAVFGAVLLLVDGLTDDEPPWLEENPDGLEGVTALLFEEENPDEEGFEVDFEEENPDEELRELLNEEDREPPKDERELLKPFEKRSIGAKTVRAATIRVKSCFLICFMFLIIGWTVN